MSLLIAFRNIFSKNERGVVMPKLNIVKRPKITGLEDFLRYFFKTEAQVTQAEKIIILLKKEKEIPVKKWDKFLLPNRSVGLYGKVMRRLRDFGLVQKKEDYFMLSRDFLTAMKKISEYWNDYTS